MFYDWKDEYLIHIESIDYQHQKLFMMVKVLHGYIESGDTALVMKNFLNELIKYTKTHFSDEERYMKEIGMPENLYQQHAQEHLDLINEVKAIKTDYDSAHKVFTPKLIKFLVDWLRNHIVHTDTKISQFLNKRAD
jgi:hemerythrin